ncbi:MAG: DUF2058 domain-containing protein [Gammaproteobacteria bacterium]|jgi:uncharacterized protein|nr:DUF2058 domain-containing protein [Gammaproteobacteria bacterium]
MSNPFQDQLLKAGLVTKQQVLKANSDKNKQNKQQRAPKGTTAITDTALKAQQIANEKANQAREFNKQKEEQARQKAATAEIRQLISSHHIKRDSGCDIAYNFEHDKKVKTIYVNEELRKQIIQGKTGIVCLEEKIELVPKAIAEKIQQRNAGYIVLFTDEQQTSDANDPYADYKVPDDLMW